MENLAEKLFKLCCTKEMPTPPSFIEIPQFRKVYGSACFDQGVRFAFSLMRRLYPPEDFIE